MSLPVKPILHGQINRCRTCTKIVPKRRKYCSPDCRSHFAERLSFLVVTLKKIKSRYASLAMSVGGIELVVMPWTGDHVSRFLAGYDINEELQWSLFEFTLTLNEQWHSLRKRLRSEQLASKELLEINRSQKWRKGHFDLDLTGPTSHVSREVHSALNALSIEAEDLVAGDFIRLLKDRFADKVHQYHPDRGNGDTRKFIRVTKARNTLKNRWETGELEALLNGSVDISVKKNPMPWSFFYDGYRDRWYYPD